MALLLALLDAGDGPARAVQVGLDRTGLDARLEVDLLSSTLDQAGGELRAGAQLACQLGVQRPVLDGYERQNLALAVDDHAHRDRLHAPGRQATAHLAAEEVADGIADQAIQDAPRLLRVDARHVDRPWILEGVLDGAARRSEEHTSELQSLRHLV